jgi:Putative peptidoglycan binding domain
VFVVFAALASFGTAYALVLSSGGQGSSVSLPPTNGNIPVAPSQKPSGQGQLSITSGSASASAVPGLSHSPKPVVRTASAPVTDPSTATAPSVSADASAGSSQSAGPSPSNGQSGGASPTTSASSGWVTLYWGIQNESPEVAQVQTMLANLGYLDGLRHHTYFNPQVDVQPDQSGDYGSATEDAVAEFQQDYGVTVTGQSGDCDLATYQALTQAAG